MPLEPRRSSEQCWRFADGESQRKWPKQKRVPGLNSWDSLSTEITRGPDEYVGIQQELQESPSNAFCKSSGSGSKNESENSNCPSHRPIGRKVDCGATVILISAT